MEDIPHKVFNDPIHGSLELDPLLIKIIDTPQFQRLRNIKQLNGKCFVYPGATHTRFEHSIGVAYLAGELVQALKEKQPELNITPADILCVKIAGLCHDLGHGPFSHLYDGMFIPKIQHGDNNSWKHETASLKMFDYLVKKNNLGEVMQQHGLKLPQDLEFIKELINPESSDEEQEWPFKGRPEDKSFLYDIVANKRNGIDVDKWDYFARDCHYLGMQSSFDYRRLIIFARVCEWKNRKEICFRDKEVFNLYDMFYTRYSLHKRAYQHKAGQIIDWMITDAFVIANEHIKIQGSGGQIFNLSTAKDDMEAYTKLTDNVLDLILNHPSTDMDLEPAKEILERIVQRKLYRCLGEFYSTRSPAEIERIKAEWEAEFRQNIPEGGIQNLQPKDFVVDVLKLNYGKGSRDPIQYVHFYQKRNPNQAIKLDRAEVSPLLPATFVEIIIRIYWKETNDQTLEAAMQQFDNFKTKHNNFLQKQ